MSKKVFSYTFLISFLSMIYVYQNIEIVKAGYAIDSDKTKLSYFLDQHNRLLYNLNELKSPVALDLRLHNYAINLIEPEAA